MVKIQAFLKQLGENVVAFSVDPDDSIIGIDFFTRGKKTLSDVLYLCPEDQTSSFRNPSGNGIFLFINQASPIEDLPHIQVQWDRSLPELFSLLQTLLLSESEHERNLSVVTEMLIKGNGIKEIIRAAAKVMNRPIILTTSSYEVIAMHDNGMDFEDEVWQEAQERGCCNARNVRAFQNQGITDKVNRSSKAFLLDIGLAERVPRILQKISYKGRIIAYLGIFIVGGPMRNEELSFVDTLADILSVEMHRHPEYTRLTDNAYKNILVGLIRGERITHTDLHDQALSSMWKPGTLCRCVLLISEENGERIQNSDYYIAEFNRNPKLKTIFIDSGILVLCSYRERKKW
ncbi:MAG: hypothetical protein HUJ73_05195, partial [Eubacterium sp.]|nr:hypothetical protein [Eubacterium sp.]